MRGILRTVVTGAVLLALLGTGVLIYVRRTGLSARATPGTMEMRVARTVRAFAVPQAVKRTANPVPATDEVLAEGMGHYADHCASCHANDGSGNTEMGRGLFPKAPDMRLPATQTLTDGELFYIIENGVRFTGMPGWSTGTKAGEASTWHLVHFVRHLPRVTPEELERMKSMTPRSPEEIRQEIQEEQFLRGGGEVPALSPTHEHPGAQK